MTIYELLEKETRKRNYEIILDHEEPIEDGDPWIMKYVIVDKKFQTIMEVNVIGEEPPIFKLWKEVHTHHGLLKATQPMSKMERIKKTIEVFFEQLDKELEKKKKLKCDFWWQTSR